MGNTASTDDSCAFTALVCTHDNAALLSETLAHLAAQQLDPLVAWEVVVVENNCSDDTAAIVHQFRSSGTMPRVRLLSEAKQGVGHARRTGLRAVRGSLIGFVDDDCWVADDWIAQALRFAAEHPRAGAFGGRNDLLWQGSPPEFVTAYGESLARQQLGDEAQQFPSVGKQVPCGAGVVLRRSAMLASGWLENGCLRGREPRHVGAGEDTEIVLRIRNAGWELWYAPSLHLRHVISPRRMTLSYLCRLHRGFGRVEVFLRNMSLHRDCSFRSRWEGLAWACGEMLRVWRRFWLGYVCYVHERPSWLIRLSYATGCIEGAVRFLVSGRGL